MPNLSTSSASGADDNIDEAFENWYDFMVNTYKNELKVVPKPWFVFVWEMLAETFGDDYNDLADIQQEVLTERIGQWLLLKKSAPPTIPHKSKPDHKKSSLSSKNESKPSVGIFVGPNDAAEIFEIAQQVSTCIIHEHEEKIIVEHLQAKARLAAVLESVNPEKYLPLYDAGEDARVYCPQCHKSENVTSLGTRQENRSDEIKKTRHKCQNHKPPLEF